MATETHVALRHFLDNAGKSVMEALEHEASLFRREGIFALIKDKPKWRNDGWLAVWRELCRDGAVYANDYTALLAMGDAPAFRAFRASDSGISGEALANALRGIALEEHNE